MVMVQLMKSIFIIVCEDYENYCKLNKLNLIDEKFEMVCNFVCKKKMRSCM